MLKTHPVIHSLLAEKVNIIFFTSVLHIYFCKKIKLLYFTTAKLVFFNFLIAVNNK